VAEKIDSPHGLLIHFLGQVEKYKGIIIIAVEKEAGDNEEVGGLVVGTSKLPAHELIGAIHGALVMSEEDYRDSYLENGEEQ